jgi:GntR family transcriptional regulator
MLLRLDPRDDAPLFVQLANTLRIAVVRGDAGPGERLPSARDLAASLDINVHTVLHAYQELRDEGLVELRRGRGATVAASAAQDSAALRAALGAVVTEASRLGLSAAVVTALLKEEGLR